MHRVPLSLQHHLQAEPRVLRVSTMTIRRAERLPRVRAGAWAVRGGASTGRLTVAIAPVRARRFAMRIVPPCISTMRRARVRPMPRPPLPRSGSRFDWKKSSNALAAVSASMPAPSSATVSTTSPPAPPPQDDAPALGVCFTALDTRFAQDLLDASAIGAHPHARALVVDVPARGLARRRSAPSA